MLIDGEKWACEACVRGHRVSNCQHYDRPLQHINKKGRPVTQCQHCRSQRKNRSAHVKCDCGEKTNKCIHLGAIEGHRESCCCNHGGRCTCSFKNDLDTVPETAGLASEEDGDDLAASAPATLSSSVSGSGCSKSPVRRRRANTTRSEGSTLTFDEHGRHKPLSQKHAKAVSQKTSPYPISRINSARSTGALSGFLLEANKNAHDDDDLDETHSNGIACSDSGAEEASVSALGNATATTASTSTKSNGSSSNASSRNTNPHGTLMPMQVLQQRRSRSETASPLLFASSFPQAHQLSTGNNQLTPLEMGAGSYNSFNYSAFASEQGDQPLFSAGLNAPPVDWSQFGLDFDRGLGANDKFDSTDAFGFTRGFGFDFNGSDQAPTMTAGTSGEVSEAEDALVPGLDDYDYDYDYDGTTDAASSSIAFSRASSSYHLPTAALSVHPSATIGSTSDVAELRFLKAGNKFLPTPAVGATDDLTRLTMTHDEDSLWMNDYSGLPNMTESPESDVASFWGAK